MSTLKEAKKIAAKFNATLIDDKNGNFHTCRCEAPTRHKWKCDNIHELVDETNRPWKPDYQDMIDRMNYGIEPCLDDDCEWCNPD